MWQWIKNLFKSPDTSDSRPVSDKPINQHWLDQRDKDEEEFDRVMKRHYPKHSDKDNPNKWFNEFPW